MGRTVVEASQESTKAVCSDRAVDHRGRHYWIRWALLGVVGVVAIFVLVSFILAFEGRARPVSVKDAVSHYHHQSGAPGEIGVHPAPGVYSYRGTGTDSLSLPPLSQPEGPTLPGTVELGAKGCWDLHIAFSTNHWQSWTYCRRPAGLEETGGQVWQRWMVGPAAVTNLSTLHCDPPSPVLAAVRTAGQSWPARCTGTSSQIAGKVVSAGSYRYLGDAAMTIGGQKVQAAHFVRKWTLSGAQVGPETDDVWFDVATGLPLENRRSIRVRTDTPFGESTYNETGEFVLRSLTPAT